MLFALIVPIMLAGCGGTSGAPAPPAIATVTGHVATPTATSGTPASARTCRPAGTNGNGGPYPAATGSDCLGMPVVEVDLIADPRSVGGFSPSNITISKGTTVTWVWKTGGRHNLAPFHTAVEGIGFRFSKTFDQQGSYPYRCQLHPGQNGLVLVR